LSGLERLIYHGEFSEELSGLRNSALTVSYGPQKWLEMCYFKPLIQHTMQAGHRSVPRHCYTEVVLGHAQQGYKACMRACTVDLHDYTAWAISACMVHAIQFLS
jgi:hypothetical protein